MSQPNHSTRCIKYPNSQATLPIFLETHKDRRIRKTNTLWQWIKAQTGDVAGFQRYLRELNNPETAPLLHDPQHEFKQFKLHLKESCMVLKMTGKFSNGQWDILHKTIYHPRFGALIPCSRTITRYWNGQLCVEVDLVDSDFFEFLLSRQRTIYSKKEDIPDYFICISHRFRWMLFLAASHLISTYGASNDESENERVDSFLDSPIVFKVDFLLWYDGAKLYGKRKGLLSAIKLVDFSIVFPTPKPIQCTHLIYQFIHRAWILNALNCAETKVDVAKIEDLLLEQLEACPKSTDSNRIEFSWNNFTLVPRFLGITSDHGIRQKANGCNSLEERCGECTAVFNSSVDIPLFLHWTYLATIKPITGENWYHNRFNGDPTRFGDGKQLECLLRLHTIIITILQDL